MSSQRVSTKDFENLKRKIAEEEFTLDEKDASQQLLTLKYGRSATMNESSSKSCRVLSEDSKPVLKEYSNYLSCKFCDKKFPNFQSLGGHQNGHKNEREKLKMLGPNNVQYYPHSFYHGAHMIHPMAHMPNLGFSLPPNNFMMTSSRGGGVPTSQWRLNTQTIWQQIHSHSDSVLKSSSSSVGAGLGGLQTSPSTNDSASADLDLSLKL